MYQSIDFYEIIYLFVYYFATIYVQLYEQHCDY